MKDELSITIPGRPVPLARARLGKGGRFYITTKQKAHRDMVAALIRSKCQLRKIKQFSGPVRLRATFDYNNNETIFALDQLPESVGFKSTRGDLDNLLKMLLESIEDSGIVKDDAQVAVIEARKIK